MTNTCFSIPVIPQIPVFPPPILLIIYHLLIVVQQERVEGISYNGLDSDSSLKSLSYRERLKQDSTFYRDKCTQYHMPQKGTPRSPVYSEYTDDQRCKAA